MTAGRRARGARRLDARGLVRSRAGMGAEAHALATARADEEPTTLAGDGRPRPLAAHLSACCLAPGERLRRLAWSRG